MAADKEKKTGADQKTGKYHVNPWLIVALLLAIAYALFSFLVVNKELEYRPAQKFSELPQQYKTSPTEISRSTMRTQTFSPRANPPQRRNLPGIPVWNAWTRIEPATGGRHNVIVYTQTIHDKPVDVEEFEAKITLVGDEKQVLPGVAFSQTGIGEYTATVTLPANGDWEVRGRLKKGLEVILIAQKIAPLMPK